MNAEASEETNPSSGAENIELLSENEDMADADERCDHSAIDNNNGNLLNAEAGEEINQSNGADNNNCLSENEDMDENTSIAIVEKVEELRDCNAFLQPFLDENKEPVSNHLSTR